MYPIRSNYTERDREVIQPYSLTFWLSLIDTGKSTCINANLFGIIMPRCNNYNAIWQLQFGASKNPISYEMFIIDILFIRKGDYLI